MGLFLNKYSNKVDMMSAHSRALKTLGLFMFGARYFDCWVADGFYSGYKISGMNLNVTTIRGRTGLENEELLERLSREAIKEMDYPQ